MLVSPGTVDVPSAGVQAPATKDLYEVLLRAFRGKECNRLQQVKTGFATKA